MEEDADDLHARAAPFRRAAGSYWIAPFGSAVGALTQGTPPLGCHAYLGAASL